MLGQARNRVSGARHPSHDPAEPGDDPDAEILGAQWADRLAHRAGELLGASLLQGGPRWPRRSEPPHGQVKVWPLVDDLEVPRSTKSRSASASICSATPGRRVSPWLRLASTWPGGDSSSSAAKYGSRPSRLGGPQKLNPTSPPGRTTRRASRRTSSHPFQIPLKLVATSNWPSSNAGRTCRRPGNRHPGCAPARSRSAPQKHQGRQPPPRAQPRRRPHTQSHRQCRAAASPGQRQPGQTARRWRAAHTAPSDTPNRWPAHPRPGPT